MSEQVDVDRVVPADGLSGKDPQFESPPTGLIVEKVEVRRRPDQDDDVADLDDAARQLAVEFNLQDQKKRPMSGFSQNLALSFRWWGKD